jgi:hypothetical protein
VTDHRITEQPQPEDVLKLAKMYALLTAISTVDQCNSVIQQYADLGISGTQHDLDHRRMRDEALALTKALRP